MPAGQDEWWESVLLVSVGDGAYRGGGDEYWDEQASCTLSSCHLANTSPTLPDLMIFRKGNTEIWTFKRIILIQVFKSSIMWIQQNIYGPDLASMPTVFNICGISVLYARGEVVTPVHGTAVLVAVYPDQMTSWCMCTKVNAWKNCRQDLWCWLSWAVVPLLVWTIW